MKRKIKASNALTKDLDIEVLFAQYRQKMPVFPMSVEQRAAQFLPFAALNGFEKSIQSVTESQNELSEHQPIL